MKSLVVYYSRTGTTKRAATAISRVLGSDIEEIIDTTDRRGIAGWLCAGRDAWLKVPAVIKRPKMNPSKYRIVIIGTPVWSFTVTPAVRTYIAKNFKRFKRVAFFSTKDGRMSKGELKAMQELCGKKPVAKLELTRKEMMSGKYYEMIKRFAKKIKNLLK